ncbi:MAG: prepilin-type N-terminal cleavage/methylation domain-containing protein [Acidobacteriota bacterium]|nr:prepilin-type N-terminal cleavage/methylation domain-containing protein [Acidobacteriota bacterium]
MKARQRGYSLIEVLIAIAITSVVLLTVITLFYMGRRNVYSGKQTTYAVSVGTRVLEDLSTMTADDLLDNFKIDDTTTLTKVTLNKVSGVDYGKIDFDSSVSRDTDNIDATNTDPNGYLAAWKKYLDPSKFAGGTIGLVITPRAAAVANAPITTAQFTKVRVYVAWDEAANRRRFAFFDTTKVRSR